MVDGKVSCGLHINIGADGGWPMCAMVVDLAV
jgi:hypothetical protein